MVRRMCVALVFPMLVVSTLNVMAADVTLTPSLGVRGEHNDNIDFSRTNKQDDYISTISPGLKLDYATPAFILQGNAALGVMNYLDHTDHNTINQLYGLKASLQPWERFKIRADGSYVKDTTLESELIETGVVTARTNRHRYSAGGGVSYRMTETSDMDADYGHTKTDFDAAGNVDFKSDYASLGYHYTFNNRNDVLTLKPYFKEINSTISREDLYGFTLGLSHKFSPTFSADASAGPRYSETNQASGESSWSLGWTAEVNVLNSWEAASLSLGYKRDVDYSPFGEPIEVNAFLVTGKVKLTARLIAGITGRLIFAKSTGNFNTTDTRYIDATPSLLYMITENHTVELAYSYSQQYNSNLPSPDDRSYDRNRVWIFFNFNFPTKL
jgi:hypothetical protein